VPRRRDDKQIHTRRYVSPPTYFAAAGFGSSRMCAPLWRQNVTRGAAAGGSDSASEEFAAAISHAYCSFDAAFPFLSCMASHALRCRVTAACAGARQRRIKHAHILCEAKIEAVTPAAATVTTPRFLPLAHHCYYMLFFASAHERLTSRRCCRRSSARRFATAADERGH